MSFTVGLDFGTHQTKVCIEDASNPAQKLYEFVEFTDRNGSQTVLFPSIVQVNIDETVKYGFVDNAASKHCVNKKLAKPLLKQIPEPKLVIPDKPVKPKYPKKPQSELKEENSTWKEQLQQLSNEGTQNNEIAIKNWNDEYTNIDVKFEQAVTEWQQATGNEESKHNKRIGAIEEQNNKLKSDYDERLIEWERNRYDLHHYRYFKLASFYSTTPWSHGINQDIITVWYLTYLLFLLQEKVGNDFFLQMGIPSGTHKQVLDMQENKAYALLIAANKLIELFSVKETFLRTKYYNLLELTEIKYDFTENDLSIYGINVMPEAYAGLVSITQQKRLNKGMSILVDIGGGTTDVAFFTIRENLPDIHAVISFPKGLNFVFEHHIQQNSDMVISEVQRIFLQKKEERTIFDSSIKNYNDQLLHEVKTMMDAIVKSFESRNDQHKLQLQD
jgi:hypothetical protein